MKSTTNSKSLSVSNNNDLPDKDKILIHIISIITSFLLLMIFGGIIASFSVEPKSINDPYLFLICIGMIMYSTILYALAGGFLWGRKEISIIRIILFYVLGYSLIALLFYGAWILIRFLYAKITKYPFSLTRGNLIVRNQNAVTDTNPDEMKENAFINSDENLRVETTCENTSGQKTVNDKNEEKMGILEGTQIQNQKPLYCILQKLKTENLADTTAIRSVIQNEYKKLTKNEKDTEEVICQSLLDSEISIRLLSVFLLLDTKIISENIKNTIILSMKNQENLVKQTGFLEQDTENILFRGYILALSNSHNPIFMQKIVNMFNDEGVTYEEGYTKHCKKVLTSLIETINSSGIDNNLAESEVNAMDIDTLFDPLFKYGSDQKLVDQQRDSVSRLSQMGPSIIDPLINRWNNKNSFIRSTDQELVEEIITNIGEPAVEPLINILRSKNNVCLSIFRVLGKLQDKRAVDSVIEYLYSDKENERGWALIALNNINDARLVEPILKIYKNLSSKWDRKTALEIVGKLYDDRLVELLMSALEDEDWSIREKAVTMLGQYKNIACIEPLIKLLQEADEHEEDPLGIKKSLPASIFDNTKSQFDNDRQESASIRKAVAETLIKIGLPGKVYITKAINDNSENVKKVLGDVISQINQNN